MDRYRSKESGGAERYGKEGVIERRVRVVFEDPELQVMIFGDPSTLEGDSFEEWKARGKATLESMGTASDFLAQGSGFAAVMSEQDRWSLELALGEAQVNVAGMMSKSPLNSYYIVKGLHRHAMEGDGLITFSPECGDATIEDYITEELSVRRMMLEGRDDFIATQARRVIDDTLERRLEELTHEAAQNFAYAESHYQAALRAGVHLTRNCGLGYVVKSDESTVPNEDFWQETYDNLLTEAGDYLDRGLYYPVFLAELANITTTQIELQNQDD